MAIRGIAGAAATAAMLGLAACGGGGSPSCGVAEGTARSGLAAWRRMAADVGGGHGPIEGTASGGGS